MHCGPVQRNVSYLSVVVIVLVGKRVVALEEQLIRRKSIKSVLLIMHRSETNMETKFDKKISRKPNFTQLQHLLSEDEC